MSRVRGDLFADDDDEEDPEGEAEEVLKRGLHELTRISSSHFKLNYQITKNVNSLYKSRFEH